MISKAMFNLICYLCIGHKVPNNNMGKGSKIDLWDCPEGIKFFTWIISEEIRLNNVEGSFYNNYKRPEQ